MSQDYEINSVFYAYVRWHYSRGLSELLTVAGNFLWFVKNFFSFRFLLKNLFAPIRSPEEAYDEDFNLESKLSLFVAKNLMRPIGFCARIVVLAIGAVSYVFVLALSFLVLIVWFLAPLILVGSLVLSVTFFTV